MTLAARLFEAHHAYSKVDDEVTTLLTELLGDFDSFTHDCYDDSIEIYGCTPSSAAWDRLHEIGFRRVWMHPHFDGTPERYLCGCKTTRPE